MSCDAHTRADAPLNGARAADGKSPLETLSSIS